MVDEELGIVLSLKQKQQLLSGLAEVRKAVKGTAGETEQAGKKAQQSASHWQHLSDKVDRFGGATGRARKVSGALFGVLVLNSQGALGPIQEVSDKLTGVGSALDDTKSKAGKWAIGLGAALTGAGAVLGTMYSKEQVAGNQLKAAIQAAGGNYDDYREKIDKAVKTGEHFGDTAARTKDALNRLVLSTHNPAQAFRLYTSVLQISAARHISVEKAALMVGRALHGQGRSLQAFGIQVTDTSKLQAKASTAAKEHVGALDAVKKAQQNLNDVQARIAASHGKAGSSALKLAEAHVGVESATVALHKATTKYGAGSGNAILASQKLAIAQGKYNEAASAGHGKTGLTLSQQISLRKAQEGLAAAQEKVIAASKKQKQAQDEVNKSGSNADQIQHQVSKYMAGQASAAANSFTGHLHAVAAVLDDKLASAGGHVYKQLTIMGPALMGMGAIMESGVIGKFAKGTKALVLWRDESKIASAVTKVWTGIQAAFNLMMDANPIMLAVIAVALLVAGFIIAYKKSKTFRDFINTLGRDIAKPFLWLAHWFGSNWHHIISDIESPFIGAWHWVSHFFTRSIPDAANAVFRWFKSNWMYILFPILMGPFGLGVAWVVKHWRGVLSFFKKLPGEIGDAFSTVGGYILKPFEWVFNKIADAWNNTAGKLSFHIPHWVPKIGGDGFSMPKIPHWGDTGESGPSATSTGSGIPGTPTMHTGGYVMSDQYVNMKPGEEIVNLPGGTTVVPMNNGSLRDIFNGLGGGDVVVPVSLTLDGKVLAETTFKYTRDKAARL